MTWNGNISLGNVGRALAATELQNVMICRRSWHSSEVDFIHHLWVFWTKSKSKVQPPSHWLSCWCLVLPSWRGSSGREMEDFQFLQHRNPAPGHRRHAYSFCCRLELGGSKFPKQVGPEDSYGATLKSWPIEMRLSLGPPPTESLVLWSSLQLYKTPYTSHSPFPSREPEAQRDCTTSLRF